MTDSAKPLAGKPFLAGNLIKSIVFCLIAVAAVGANFFLESKIAGGQQITDDTFRKFNLAGENVVPDNGLMRFDASASAGLYVVSAKDGQYVFKLSSGVTPSVGTKFWADFGLSDVKVDILLDKIVLIPQHAAFDVDFDGKKLQLNVYSGDVIVGFLPDGSQISDYRDGYSQVFMNRVLVARDNQMIIPVQKVTDKIAPLLYLKLIKEFKYSALPDSVKKSDYVQKNLATDKKFFEGIRQQVLADSLKKGAVVKGGFLNSFLFWSQENLTFVPGKNQRIIFEHLFSYLDNAIFYAGQGDQAALDQSLADFDAYLLNLPQTAADSELFYQKIDDYLQKLSVFDPGEKQYQIYKFLLDKKFVAGRDKYEIVGLLWADFYRALDGSDVLAENALDLYYKYFEKTLNKVSSDPAAVEFNRMYLTYQNQLLDNLFLKSPLFYKDGYFVIKNGLESELVKIYQAGQMRDELKQALISNKLSFLKRLRKNFFDGNVEVKDANEIFARLVGEINDLMPGEDKKVAVAKLFEQELADIYDFGGYLNSSEYQSTTYGATNAERYKTYLHERKTIWSFIDLQQQVLGEVPTKNTSTIVDIATAVGKVFKANADVVDFKIGKIKNADQRYIEVKFVLGGYPVDASYDVSTDTLTNVKVYSKVVTDRAVKLGSLLPILQAKFADLAKDLKIDKNEKVTVETSAQRFARAFIVKKIGEVGFEAKIENISVVDQLNSVYRVDSATLPALKGAKEMKVTFDMVMSEEIATNVLVVTNSQPKVIDGKYKLEDLVKLLTAESDFSVPVKNETLGTDGVVVVSGGAGASGAGSGSGSVSGQESASGVTSDSGDSKVSR